MSIQFDIAKQIIAKTCPNRKLKWENIRLFAEIFSCLMDNRQLRSSVFSLSAVLKL